MFFRMAGLAALGLGAATLSGAPVKTRYQVDQTIEQIMDASGVGGGPQRQRFSVSTFVTVTLSDTSGGKTVHAVIDSMRADTATPVGPGALDSVRGTELHGFVGPGGRLQSLRVLRETSLAPQVAGVLRQLFPALRPGVKPGDRWTDTTETGDPAGAAGMAVRRITTYQAQRDPRASGGVRVDASFTATVNGTQPTPGGTATIRGNGSGTESYYLAPDGRYLGGNSNQSSRLTVSGEFAPKPVPITLTETMAVRELR